MSQESRIIVGDLKPGDIAILKQVADEAATQAVKKTFIAMGLDPEDPIEAQADMVWLRNTRERCEGVEGKAVMTAVGLFVVGSLAAFWAGFKSLLH